MLNTIARLAPLSAMLAIVGAGAAYAQAQPQPAAAAAAAPGPIPAAQPAANEPPPVLPTTGDGAVVAKVLTDVCQPMLEGRGQFVPLVTAAGFTKDRRSDDYIYRLDPRRPYQISMRQPSQANRNVCELNIRYAPGWQGPIIEALNVWRFLHEPQMRLQRNEAYDDPNARAQRTINTWDNYENQGFDGAIWGLVITQLKNPDGTPTNPQYAEALIQYAKRPALPAFVAQANAYREAMRQQELQQQQQAPAQPVAPAQPSAEAAPTTPAT